MRSFLLKTLLFLSVVFCIILVSMIFSNMMIRNNADFKFEPETKYVVFGHSHSKCAYNDSIIKNFKNISNNGESYFYTLPKLKQVIIQNPNIETVFIEFTNSQISKDIESWIWEDKYLSYHYCIYSPFISVKDKFFLCRNNPKGFIANLSVDFKTQFKTNIFKDYSFEQYCGFNKVTGDLDQYLQKMKDNKDLDDFVNINNEISECHLKYLDKIVSFLKSQKKEVIFVRSPIHKEYKEYFANEDSFQNLLNTRYRDIDFLDFHNVTFEDSCYKDYRHLNYKGALLFSQWFDFLIKNGLLKSENKNIFISSKNEFSIVK